MEGIRSQLPTESLDIKELVSQSVRTGTRIGLVAFAEELAKLGVPLETINRAIDNLAIRTKDIREEIGDPKRLIYDPTPPVREP